MTPSKHKITHLNGLWVIHKPIGPTSHDIVSFIRSKSRIQQVGHTGTLDPLASGVLIICVGKATRLIEYLNDEKEYEAAVCLGRTTDTLDAAGTTVAEKEVPSLTKDDLEKVLSGLRGKIQQIPPMVSAKRHQGKRLYELAREGKEVERKPVEVHVKRLDLLGFTSPVIRLSILCSAGTYIRSLAADIGEKLGCGAYLQSLVRLKVGAFSLQQALTPDQWEENWLSDQGQRTLVSMKEAAAHLPSITIVPEKAKVLLNGRPLIIADEDYPNLNNIDYFDPPFLSVFLPDGPLFAIASLKRKIKGWIVKVDKVFLVDIDSAKSNV